METSDCTRQFVLLEGRPISHVFHEVARSETREKRQGVDVGHRLGLSGEYPDESSELPAM